MRWRTRRFSETSMFLGIAVLLSGCLHDGETDDPRPLQAEVLPEGLELRGAQVLEHSSSKIVWSWSGRAAPFPGVYQTEVDDDLAPYAETQLDLPASMKTLLAVSLLPEPSPQDMGLLVLNPAGEVLCQGDNACGAAIDALGAPSTASIRVVSRYVEPPGAPFEVHVTLAIPVADARLPSPDAPTAPIPHVVLAITDSGINPYHEDFYRPDLTAHPCGYVRDFPCDTPALNLSVGLYDDFALARVADAETWSEVEPGQWYWIPRTNIVGAACNQFHGATCILDDDLHGTAVASAAVQQNPDVLLVVADARETGIPLIMGSGIPIDVHSFSHGDPYGASGASAAAAGQTCQESLRETYFDPARLFVTAVGNAPYGGAPSALADCAAGNPYAVGAGGAYADRTESWGTRHGDVVADLCASVARHDSVDGRSSLCGTSISAPIVAGALSRVILDLRRESGYLGSSTGDGLVDPLLRLSRDDIRSAMNMTASYTPTGNSSSGSIPLLTPAPWMQWGWGFYDATTVNATLAHLLGKDVASKPDGAVQWMEAQHEAKRRLWGS